MLPSHEEGVEINICGLQTSYLLNSEVEDLPERIKKNIPGPLMYSCQYWAAHLRDVPNVREGHGALLKEIHDFFHDLFLFWLEVMSLVKQVPAANVALVVTIPWVDVGNFSR